MNAVAPTLDRAIVVGINRYPGLGDPKNPRNLNGPVYDATVMASWLNKTAGAHVTLITSDGDGKAKWNIADFRPERADVEPTFLGLIKEGLALQADNRPSRLGRRLYVYMAGHGFSPDARSLSLITADALSDTYLPNIEATAWVDWFALQYHFDEIVLWMDCCATLAFDYLSGKPLLRKGAARASGRAKVFMGFAASPATDTFEEKFPDGQVRGVFTERLLRGLSGHAADEKNNITTSSLIRFMQNSGDVVGTAPTQSSSAPRPQTSFPERDEMILATVQRPTYRLLVPLPDGSKLRVFKGARVVASGQVVGGVVTVALPSGLFKAVADGFSKPFQIASGASNDVDLR